MRKRIAPFLVLLVAVMLLAAPAAMADITLTDMHPSSARAGTSVTCTIHGTFHTGQYTYTPYFDLYTTGHYIRGTVSSWTGTSATVEFALPSDSSVGLWTLRAAQEVGQLPPLTEYWALLGNAFSMLDPVPLVTDIDPTSVVAGGGDLTLTVHGNYFRASAGIYGGSYVIWNGTLVTTHYESPTLLTATVPAANVATPGTATVVVRNVTDGTSSNAVTFTISHPLPTITSISPSSVVAGSGNLTLTVRGNNFLEWVGQIYGGSAVMWNELFMETHVASPTMLTAPVDARYVATPGTVTVGVRNWTDNTYSNTVTFVITAPTPTLAALDPSSTLAGGAAFDLGVTGTSFMTGPSGAVVVWNGADLATTRDSSTHLTAAVPASLVTATGTASITVRNGTDAGAPLSNALSFRIGALVPTLTLLSPTEVWAGYVKDDVTLIVNGADFLLGAHVMLGATEKASTSFVAATKLTLPLLAADIASPGTIDVGVKNPPPAGGTSAATLPLAVVAETTDPVVTIGGADSAWHNAPVLLTFSAMDSQSGVQAVRYRCPPTVPDWTTETSYTVPITTQGAIDVGVRALDWCDHLGTASATVRIDTTPPTTDALNAVGVKKGKTAKLKFRIGEPAGLSPTALVVLKVKAVKSGKAVKSKTLTGVPVNATQTYRFMVTFKKGSYRWYLYATDLAGNVQANVDSARFRVK